GEVDEAEDEEQRERHDDREPRLRLLQVLELAAELEVVAVRKLDLALHLRRRLLDEALDVPAAEVDQDRSPSLVRVAVYRADLLDVVHRRDVPERDDPALLRPHARPTDLLDARAERLGQPHDDGRSPVPVD